MYWQFVCLIPFFHISLFPISNFKCLQGHSSVLRTNLDMIHFQYKGSCIIVFSMRLPCFLMSLSKMPKYLPAGLGRDYKETFMRL